MIPNNAAHQVTSSPVVSGGEFGISYKDSAHIMTILRDTLYTDKILAVLREYGANAWDAHRMCGKGAVPIKVTLPSTESPTLEIRDYGPGLSPDEVIEIFTQYGASTKRDSDTAVGMLGIGCKSGFAYSDSFTVTSYNGGFSRVYVAALDPTNKGVMNLIHSEPCDAETGLLIQIPVTGADIPTFEAKAQWLFQFFTPRPEINTELPPMPQPEFTGVHGELYPARYAYYGRHAGRGESWYATMGCVPYRLNLNQVEAARNHLGSLTGVLYFDIGAVQVSASREELKYSDSTKAAIAQKATDLIDEYVTATLRRIKSSALSSWKKRLEAQKLRGVVSSRMFGDSLPESVVEIDAEKDVPKTFTLRTLGGSAVARIVVDPDFRLLIRDETKRALSGYRLSESRVLLVTPTAGSDIASVRNDLDAFLLRKGLDGIPVDLLSAVSWAPLRSSRGSRTSNVKHRKAMFQFVLPSAPYYHCSSTLSDNWEVASGTPSPQDICVVLSKFEVLEGGYNFYSSVRQDLQIAGIFKQLPFPKIYGYKSTSKDPVTVGSVAGTPYDAWRVKYRERLLADPVVLTAYQHWAWAVFGGERPGYAAVNHAQSMADTLSAALGDAHPLTTVLVKRNQGFSYLSQLGGNHALEILTTFFNAEHARTPAKESRELWRKVAEHYPLLTHPQLVFPTSISTHTDAWIEYFKSIDQMKGLP